MNSRDLSSVNKSKSAVVDPTSKVIIKRTQTNQGVSPILELRVHGASCEEQMRDNESNCTCSNSAIERNDEEDEEQFKERVTEIIQNTFNTSTKVNKYKINTHDFLMN